MEETIGYEAPFSAEEWDALTSGDRSDIPPDDFPEPGRREALKHSVSIANPPGQYEGKEAR